MCERCSHSCAGCQRIPQKKKPNRITQTLLKVVYITVLFIPETLLKILAMARMKKAIIKQFNSMPPEMRVFYAQLSQVMAGKTPLNLKEE